MLWMVNILSLYSRCWFFIWSIWKLRLMAVGGQWRWWWSTWMPKLIQMRINVCANICAKWFCSLIMCAGILCCVSFNVCLFLFHINDVNMGAQWTHHQIEILHKQLSACGQHYGIGWNSVVAFSRHNQIIWAIWQCIRIIICQLHAQTHNIFIIIDFQLLIVRAPTSAANWLWFKPKETDY